MGRFSLAQANTKEEELESISRRRRHMYPQVVSALVGKHILVQKPAFPSVVVVEGRSGNATRERLDWDWHLSRVSDAEFARLYRMPKTLFATLCDTLRPHLIRNTEMARRGSPSGEVAPELQLSMVLRYCAGGSYLDITLLHGVHRATFFAILRRVVAAINSMTQLTFSTDLVSLQEAARGFQGRMNNPLRGCVAALDGLAIKIVRPRSSLCPNSKDYYSRKSIFAFNLQAACDSRYKFVFASCKTPGSTHDSVAFNASAVGRQVAEGLLPEGFWIAADEAYASGKSVLTPWSGRKLTAEKDSFNFHLSSSRIHIEQAFGLLVARWGVLWRAIDLDYRFVPRLVMALLKLHNLCLENKAPIVRRDAADVRPGDSFRLQMRLNFDADDDLRRRRRDLERKNCPARTEQTEMLLQKGIFRPAWSTNSKQ